MSCGTGLKTKERSIVEQATNGGKPCEGHSIETELCKLKDCFGMYIRINTMKPKHARILLYYSHYLIYFYVFI